MTQTAEPVAASRQNELLHISMALIRENPIAIRGVARDSEDFIRLVDSIRNYGVLNPISVRRKEMNGQGHRDGREYEVVDGLQRFTASLDAGRETIAAQVLTEDEDRDLYRQIVANAHKIEMKPVEYSRALLKILTNNPLMTEADLAAQISMSPSFVAQRLGLQKLRDDVAKLVNEGTIPLNNAYALSKLPVEVQKDWVPDAIGMGAGEFGPKALAEAKRLRDAKRAASQAGPAAEFQPVPVQRKLGEIKDEYNSGKAGPALIAENGITDPATAFALAIKWVLQMDPQSVVAAKQRDAERKKKAEDEKAKKKAERETKGATAAQTSLVDQATAANGSATAAEPELAGASR